MPFANNGPNWTELPPGRDVLIDGVWSSYATVSAWSDQERNKLGIDTITDSEIPEGRSPTSSTLVDMAGRPVRLWETVAIEPSPVNLTASAAQCKIALYEAGLLAKVEAAVAAHPYPPVRIWYESANEWERSNGYVQALAAELELSDATIDTLFEAAARKR